MSARTLAREYTQGDFPATGYGKVVEAAGGTTGALSAWGITTPSTASTYAPACILQDTVAKLVYVNTGTYASPSFDAISTIAATQTLTNKTLDADSNTVSNINADELDPVANATYGVPFCIRMTVTNQNATGIDIFTDNAPFKFRVLDAWSVNTSASGGTWAVHKGKVGALGNAITDVVTAAASDTDIDRATTIDDAEHEIAASGSLAVVADAGGAMDIELYVLCMRVD